MSPREIVVFSLIGNFIIQGYIQSHYYNYPTGLGPSEQGRMLAWFIGQTLSGVLYGFVLPLAVSGVPYLIYCAIKKKLASFMVPAIAMVVMSIVINWLIWTGAERIGVRDIPLF